MQQKDPSAGNLCILWKLEIQLAGELIKKLHIVRRLQIELNYGFEENLYKI